MADEEDVEYEIREVLNERRRGKVLEYLIDWKPTAGQTWDPTWEPAENVSETALAYYKEQKKKNAANKKKKGAAKKRKTPAKSAKKKKGAKGKAVDDSDAMNDDDDENSTAVNNGESQPKSKRQKTTPKSSRKVGGETTEEAKITSDADSSTSRYKHLDDDDDADLYPKKIVHFVPELSQIPLSSSGLKSDSRLANLKHYYGEEATARLARVLRLDTEQEITDEMFEHSETGLPLSDLLLRGVFSIGRGVPNRYVKRLRTCASEILSMIEEKFSTSHRLAGDCKNIYDASSVELAEVQKRGTTLDFSLNWWREHYDVLNRVAYHAQWYRTVVKALGHFFNCKMKCEWIGLLHSPPGSRGQVVHRDGRSKRFAAESSSSSSSKKASAEESKASNDSAVEMFMSPRNPGVPRVPSSITVCVPLCDIAAVAEDAMADDADLPEENDDRRHNGATEFFLSSHMSEFLAKDSVESTNSSSSSTPPRYVTVKGPFPKTVVTARAGDCFGWGFDFAHNGGPNASTEARQMMYFVYHAPGSAQDDENIKQFKDSKAAGSTLFMGNYSKKEDFIP